MGFILSNGRVQCLDAQIDVGRQFSDPDNARLAKQLRKQRAHLFAFLTAEGVEASNNQAEGIETGGCNRQPRGAKTHEILTKSPTHPHGIKVRLESGQVGRIKEIKARIR